MARVVLRTYFVRSARLSGVLAREVVSLLLAGQVRSAVLTRLICPGIVLIGTDCRKVVCIDDARFREVAASFVRFRD